MLFCQHTHKISPWFVTAKPSFTVQTIDCTHQTGPRKGASICSMLTSHLTFNKSFTVMISVSKIGAVLHQAWSESQCTVLLRYFTILINVRCCSMHHWWNFVFQQYSAPVHLAFNIVQLRQCKTLNFLSLELWPLQQSLTSLNTRLGSHTAAWAWVKSNKTE